MATQTKKSTTKKSTSTRKTAPKKRLYERDPRELVQETAYAVAAFAQDAAELVRELPDKAKQLRDDAPNKLQQLRTESEERARKVPGQVKLQVHNRRQQLEARARDTRGKAHDLRTRTVEELDGRLSTFEKKFDAKAKEGRKVYREVRNQPQVKAVLDQAGNTRSQVKAAVTSIRKTAGSAVDAAKAQAGNARVQIKAAATSATKTAETVADAGRELAS